MDLNCTQAALNPPPSRTIGATSSRAVIRRLFAYLELTKPRVTALILVVAWAGFWCASGGLPDRGLLLVTMAGLALLASGMFALNHFMERDLDALMQRTQSRPLPSGRLKPSEALWFGIVTAIAALFVLSLINVLTAVLGLLTLASYLLLYTPLKRRTPRCTFIGAFPGAMPPLVGWVAARNELGLEALGLFAIVFLWQFPHFHSIAYLYREDYARSGVRMWPVVEPGGRVMGRQIVAAAALLVPASLLPTPLGMSGQLYAFGALLLGAAFLFVSFQMAVLPGRRQAQRLLLASVVYLPALLLLMLLNR